MSWRTRYYEDTGAIEGPTVEKSDAVVDGSTLEDTAATGSLGDTGSGDTGSAVVVLVPRTMLALAMVLTLRTAPLLWPPLVLRMALAL